MKTTETLIGDVMVVELIGQRLDASTSPLFKSGMVDRINRGHRLFALDFSRLDFLDSTGLGAIISSLKSLGGEGDMVLFSLRESVRKVFAVTRLDRGVFRIFDNREDALKNLGGTRS